MRLTLQNFLAGSGLVLAVALSACSSGDDEADLADEQQTTDSAGDESPAEDEADGETSAALDESTADEPAARDEPEAEDESESAGEPASIGGTTIGGEEAGLTLEIPDDWVELPLDDAGAVSEAAVGSLDLEDDQAAFIESSTGVLPSRLGPVMAVDLSTATAGVAANTNAYCGPNDGRVGRREAETTPPPLQENDLEHMIGLATWDRFGREAEDIESTTVNGHPAARATYTLDMTRPAGVGVMYMLLADDDICWVTFAGADDSSFGLFDEIASGIRVL